MGIRKMSNPEPLFDVSSAYEWHRNRGRVADCGSRAWRVSRFLARWCPAWRRHEPDLLLLQGTWEGAS